MAGRSTSLGEAQSYAHRTGTQTIGGPTTSRPCGGPGAKGCGLRSITCSPTHGVEACQGRTCSRRLLDEIAAPFGREQADRLYCPSPARTDPSDLEVRDVSTAGRVDQRPASGQHRKNALGDGLDLQRLVRGMILSILLHDHLIVDRYQNRPQPPVDPSIVRSEGGFQ